MTTTLPTKMMTLSDTAEYFSQSDNFMIFTHIYPDGDTIGSSAALCIALRMLGKQSFILPNATISDRYVPYLQGLLPDHNNSNPAKIIAVDIADTTLLTEDAAPFASRIDLCIDHHPSNRLYAQHTLLDATAAATGEIILDLIRSMGLPLTPELALPLYLAISTDTGCFRFSNTTSRTLRAAADLLDTGIAFHEINTLFFETRSRSRILIEQRMMENISFYEDGRIAIAAITRKMRAETGAKEEDLENTSSFLRSIEGVEIAVLLRERSDDLWKLSVRTSAVADASRICAALGGGGHARAAGCTLTGTRDEAIKAILQSIEMERSIYA